ncbi:MAG: hypothetical protein H6712_24870 [Myxococcales bacterium]|nr:hypothetical protein [Myxococcales bacterium]MCB9717112.1 hypothetical protein [Myxococcales bacterium]
MRRLTFIARGGNIELAYDQSVDMIAPGPVVSGVDPSDDGARLHAAMSGVGPADGAPSFWYELRDADGNVLLQQAADDPIRSSVEVFSEQEGATMSRASAPTDEQVFTVLLPEIDEARVVRLMRAPATGDRDVGLAAATVPDAAQVVASFDLEIA